LPRNIWRGKQKEKIMQIRSRLLVLAGISAAATVLVGAVAWFCGAQVQLIAKENILIGVAIRHHLEADMMHDAIRGDTLAALLALSAQRMDEKEQIFGDFKNHVDIFQHALEENGKLDLREANRNAIDEIKPALGNYIDAGQALID
jgi:methyl-accepting chemotaxis protein